MTGPDIALRSIMPAFEGVIPATIATASADGTPNITAFLQFPDVPAAASFLDNPALAEAMKEAGVIGTPEVQITELVESTSY